MSRPNVFLKILFKVEIFPKENSGLNSLISFKSRILN